MYYIENSASINLFDENKIRNNSKEVTLFLAGNIYQYDVHDCRMVWWRKDAVNLLVKKVAALCQQVAPILRFFDPVVTTPLSIGTKIRQVAWEQAHLAQADYILMNLTDLAHGENSLLEFGEYVKTGKLFVSCNPEFAHYIIVKQTAVFYGKEQQVVDTLDEVTDLLAQRIAFDLGLGGNNSLQLR